MIRLLQIELFKLWNNKLVKVLIFMYLGLLSLLALLTAVKFNIGLFTFDLAKEGVFDFPIVWKIAAFITAWFKVFLAIIIINSITMEYSGRTLKQNLIDGLSKREFLFSKFLAVVFFSLVATLFITLLSSLLGWIHSADYTMSDYFEGYVYMLGYFVKHIAFISFCMLVALLIRKSALTLGLVFVWYVFELIILLLIRWTFKMPEVSAELNHYLPLMSIYYLTPEPFSQLETAQQMGQAMGAEVNYDNGFGWKAFATAIVWTGVYLFLGYRILKKRDL